MAIIGEGYMQYKNNTLWSMLTHPKWKNLEHLGTERVRNVEKAQQRRG